MRPECSNQQDRADLQNFTSWQAGKHFVAVTDAASDDYF
jgi:hypothetical protein